MAVISVLKSRWRWLVLIHPALMTLSIIATANHWWIDAAAAAVLVLIAIGSLRLLCVWAGDRHWSWTRMRFEAAEGIERLESFANEQVNERADC
jgi:hypothetical protein